VSYVPSAYFSDSEFLLLKRFVKLFGKSSASSYAYTYKEMLLPMLSYFLSGIFHTVGSIGGKFATEMPFKFRERVLQLRKYCHSPVLQALTDDRYKCTIIDVGACSKQSNGGIFRDSSLHRLLNNFSILNNNELPLLDAKLSFVVLGVRHIRFFVT